jgi:Flp pilus assembly protein TadD
MTEPIPGAPQAQDSNPAASGWRKWRRAAKAVLIALIILNAFVAGLRTVSDSDMGWHLATGRYVVEHHSIPRTDVLTFTSRGDRWIYPPLGGVVLFLTYASFGYAGLSWLCAILSALIAAYLLRRGDAGSLILLILGVESIAFRVSPRSDLFTTVLFALLLGELWAFSRGTSARLWTVPLVMLLWVNLHPGFIAGVAILAAYVFTEGCELLFSLRREPAVRRLKQAWPWIVAGLGATLVNPFGARIYEASLTLAGWRGFAPGALNSATYIAEFLPVPLTLRTIYRAIDVRNLEHGYYCLIILSVAIAAIALWRKQPAAAVLQGAALYLAIQHSRYIALFCITTVIVGGSIVSSLLPEVAARFSRYTLPPPRRGFAPLLPLAAAGLLAALTVLQISGFVTNRNYVVFQSESGFGAGLSNWFPDRAIRFIRREKLPGNVFEEFSVGGFAALTLGSEYPTYIDGRADRLNPALFLEQQQLTADGPASPQWDKMAGRWNVNVLLLSEAGTRSTDKLDALGFCHSAEWRPVYMDEVSLVLLRNTPANQPLIQKLAIDCDTQPLSPGNSASDRDLYDFSKNAGSLFYVLRRDSEAEAMLLKAAALFPEDPNSRLLLASLYQRQRQFSRAEAAYLESISRLDSDKAWYELGRLYTFEGRLVEARSAFARASALSIRPMLPYMALARVELGLKDPAAALESLNDAERSSPYRGGGEGLAPELYAQLADGRAQAYAQQSQFARAVTFQEQAVRLTPLSAGRWTRLAELYDASGNAALAAQARGKAQELAMRAQ